MCGYIPVVGDRPETPRKAHLKVVASDVEVGRVKMRCAVLLVPLVIAACGDNPPRWSDKSYADLKASFAVPSGFTPASPDGPCKTDSHMQCWTTTALPMAAAKAAVAALGADFTTTDTSWCSTQHWAQQRKAWGEAHTPCTLRGTARGLEVRVEAIAFPDSKKRATGNLVFPPTLVSITASAP